MLAGMMPRPTRFAAAAAVVAVAAVAAVAAGLGCGRAAPVPAAPPAAAPGPLLTLTEAAAGPLRGGMAASLQAMRDAFRGFEVMPINVAHHDEDELPAPFSLEYRVYAGGEKLLEVVPDHDGTIATVHATSARVAVAAHGWKIGAPFTGVEVLTDCACMRIERRDVPICFRAGEHLAVGFARRCHDLSTPALRKALAGDTVERAIWSPRAFDPSMFGGAAYGGDFELLGDLVDTP